MDTLISFGSTLLGAFLGKKTMSVGNIGRAATTMRGVGRAMEQSSDVTRAGDTVGAIQQQLADLDAQFRAENDALAGGPDPAAAALETIELRPSKSNIQVRLVALVWLPFTRDAAGILNAAYWSSVYSAIAQVTGKNSVQITCAVNVVIRHNAKCPTDAPRA